MHMGRHLLGITERDKRMLRQTLGGPLPSMALVGAGGHPADAGSLNQLLEHDLIQIVPSSLVGRLLHFDRAETAKKIAPSFLDAPYGDMTMIFMFTQALGQLKNVLSAAVFQEMLRTFSTVVRGQMMDFEGYEVRKGQGSFVVAFKSAARAIQFALSVQEAIMRAQWPSQVVALPQCNKVVLNNVQLFYGPRVQIGMSTGEAVSIMPTASTGGRADYYGSVANIAARIASAAQGGQTLVSEHCWRSAHEEVKAVRELGLEANSLGKYKLKGVDNPVEILQVHNQRLRMRPFKEIATNAKVAMVEPPQAAQARQKPVIRSTSRAAIGTEWRPSQEGNLG